MEKPSAVTVNWFQEAVPADPRAVRGQMFGHPCAFVNGNMFFGTFGQSVVVRIGEVAAAARAGRDGIRIFEPMEGRAWKEYVQIDLNGVSDGELAGLARAALDHTAALPAKAKKPAGRAGARGEKGKADRKA